jgi:tetratricopeptide (TPR) repeat protein
MTRNARFWTAAAVFQIAFGVAVFAVTRSYYIGVNDHGSASAAAVERPALELPRGISASDISQLGSPPPNDSIPLDPAQLSRQADLYFANREYAKAAGLYEQLLDIAPDNVEIHNNLGLTLHYLGRSDEALQRLKKGVAVDPDNQRIWLTTGFVNSQLGNVKDARTALTTATQIGTDESIRQSAMTMLENLP